MKTLNYNKTKLSLNKFSISKLDDKGQRQIIGGSVISNGGDAGGAGTQETV